MGIGFLEIVVIAVVALVLLGPQRLPELMRQLGRFYVQLRRTSSDFRGVVDQVVRQAEAEVRLEEIKRLTALAEESEKRAVAAEQLNAQQESAAKNAPLARSPSALDAWNQPTSAEQPIKDPIVAESMPVVEKNPT